MASSSSSSSFSQPCPICLEAVKQEAFLDRCFHSFCYDCIVRWSRLVRAKQSVSSIQCPLCKTENFSVLYCFDGESFRRHYVNEDHNKSWLSSSHEFRLRCYNNGGIPASIFDVQRYWKLRRYLQKNIWLQSWLRREIQSLTQEEDVDIIVHHLLGVVEAFMRRKQQEGFKAIPVQVCEEFKSLLSDAARPFILGQTVHFISELEQFLASGLNIEAYDKACIQALSISSAGVGALHDEVCGRAYQEGYPIFPDEDSSD